jgi:hypothetical protein
VKELIALSGISVLYIVLPLEFMTTWIGLDMDEAVVEIILMAPLIVMLSTAAVT